ncbi:hypothetical protein EV143_11063 [Flavobacterium chryseum]|uniref:hypothetical protein n=1 Tax=Flavobacterium sp. P3160 TaxID=2512113 RepID=UPI00105CBC96|nr:hypothetical protein [Flavobacterium sp. P3160]TDO71071.1 hypothetical protein EV143_11063 [Flavobacterium sp. P3160]
MNWILKNTDKLEFHTSLTELLYPIFEDLKNCNWVLSDLDFIAHEEITIEFGKEYYILDEKDFEKFAKAKVQIIWGVISAIPKNESIELDINNLPYVEGNDDVWKDGNLQLSNSLIEIIAFDSSYTIIKFKSLNLSEKFKKYFDEAIELEKYK